MFGIGSTELLVILVVALIVLGPKSLAGLSRSLGKAVGEFRRVSTDFQRTLNAEAAEEELKEQRMKRAAEEAVQNSPRQKEAGPDIKDTSPWERPNNSQSASAQSAEARTFEDQMSRIGKWEKPNPNAEFAPPPGSPMAEAMEKARKEADSSANSLEAQAANAPKPSTPNQPEQDARLNG